MDVMWVADSTQSEFRAERDESESASEPLLVSGRFDVWWLWTAVAFSLVLGILGAFVHDQRPLAAPVLFVASAAFAASAAAAAFWQWRRRAWISWDGIGFRIADRNGAHEHLDSDVAAIAVHSRWQHSFGRVVAERHEVAFWLIDSPDRPWRFCIDSEVGEAAPVAPLLARLQARLHAAAEDALRRGLDVAGDGWTWRDSRLTIVQGRRALSIPIEEITAIDSGHQGLRIWRGFDPQPAAQLKLSSRSAWLLSRLLSIRFGRPGEPEVPQAPGLGRVLLEHRPKNAAVVAFLMGLMAATVAGVCFAAAVLLRMVPLALLGGGVGLTSLAMISTSFRLSRSCFRFHEGGVSQASLSGHRTLCFDEIDQFAFDARRQYSRGRYLGTVFTMVFLCESRPRSSILHTQRAAFETAEVTSLRERISEELAGRLARQWREERSVAWTPELTLREDHLRFRQNGFLPGRKLVVDIPLAVISDYDVHDGWFRVWGADGQPLFRTRTSASNFYPGLLLFEQLAPRIAESVADGDGF
ncbi:MAG: hypothetical protein KF774_01700 [Planctomyces sp.]|nr:hypothetical protein [Planctomyces sp.]